MCRSGLAHGLELMMDAESYDNADPSAESDGFTILLKNAYEAPLVGGHCVHTYSTVALHPSAESDGFTILLKNAYEAPLCAYCV